MANPNPISNHPNSKPIPDCQPRSLSQTLGCKLFATLAMSCYDSDRYPRKVLVLLYCGNVSLITEKMSDPLSREHWTLSVISQVPIHHLTRRLRRPVLGAYVPRPLPLRKNFLWVPSVYISSDQCYLMLPRCWSRRSFRSLSLDYCNSLFYSITDGLMSRLQSVQKAAARLVSGARCYDHKTPVLQELHWLPVRRRVEFKMACVLVYLSLSGMALAFLAADCQQVSDEGRRQLRSAS